MWGWGGVMSGRCGAGEMWGWGDVGLGEAVMTAPEEPGKESREAQLGMGHGQLSCAARDISPTSPTAPPDAVGRTDVHSAPHAWLGGAPCPPR